METQLAPWINLGARCWIGELLKAELNNLDLERKTRYPPRESTNGSWSMKQDHMTSSPPSLCISCRRSSLLPEHYVELIAPRLDFHELPGSPVFHNTISAIAEDSRPLSRSAALFLETLENYMYATPPSRIEIASDRKWMVPGVPHSTASLDIPDTTRGNTTGRPRLNDP